MEITWSPLAIKKIKIIGDFIAKNSPKRAVEFVDRLIESAERIGDFPYSGQVTRENPAFRQLVFHSYRLIYRIQHRSIEIMTVLAPKENAEVLKRRRVNRHR